MRPILFRSAWVLIAAILFGIADRAAAREAVVILQDGRQLRGDVVSETDSQITLDIANIKTPIAKDSVREIKYIATLAEEYQEKRSQVADDDVDGRYRLTQWLYGQISRDDKALRLTQQELRKLAADFPDDARVSQLLNIVESRIRLEEEAAARQAAADATARQPEPAATTDQTPAGDGAAEAAALDGKAPTQMLTPEQVNMIRIYEVELDTKPRVTVPRDVRSEILTKYSDDPLVPKGRVAQNRFYSAPGYEVLDLIFSLQAREYYDDVVVHDDPPALQTFRSAVHTRYVLNNCGTTQCHGGINAGDFFLFRALPNNPQTVYTNFFILHSYRDGAQFMIKRSAPDESLLLQYGLPQNVARWPHPEVVGWRPSFRSPQDPQFQTVVDWINQLYPYTPDYNIDYTPPTIAKPAAPDGSQTDEQAQPSGQTP